MAQFNVHDAKSQFSHLLDLVEQGEEVIVARNGRPVAQLVPLAKKQSILGSGVGDSNYRGHLLTDEEVLAPLDEDELTLWYGEELAK